MVLTEDGCSFGGYAHVAWRSSGGFVSDPSGTSFVFTITNPYDVPPRVFPLQRGARAIWCGSQYGPIFGEGYDILIGSPCNALNNQTCLGTSYANDTGVDGNLLLAGAQKYAVKEIEVFELVPMA
jgi:hypothetical protein